MAYKKQKTKLLVLALMLLGVLALSQPAEASSIAKDSVIKLVNDARAKAELAALTENSLLSQAAKNKAADMIKKDYFAHNSLDGKTPWFWMEKAGYDYKYAGENLAVNFSSVEKQQEAWMKSETHRKNILNKNYQEIGVAVTRGKISGEETTLVVQMFGAPFVAVVSQNKKPIPVAEEIKVASEKETAVLPAEVFKTEVAVPTPSEVKIKPAPSREETAKNPTAGRANYPWMIAFGIVGLSFIGAPFFLVAKGYQLLLAVGKAKKTVTIKVKEIVHEYQDFISHAGQVIVQNDGSFKIKVKSG